MGNKLNLWNAGVRERAIMNNIRIGASGYSYKDWLAPVYPPGTPQKICLTLFEQEFNKQNTPGDPVIFKR